MDLSHLGEVSYVQKDLEIMIKSWQNMFIAS